MCSSWRLLFFFVVVVVLGVMREGDLPYELLMSLIFPTDKSPPKKEHTHVSIISFLSCCSQPFLSCHEFSPPCTEYLWVTLEDVIQYYWEVPFIDYSTHLSSALSLSLMWLLQAKNKHLKIQPF